MLFATRGIQTPNDIKWDFAKFLVNRKGEVIQRFESYIEPEQIAPYIELLLLADV
ncbi:hypothetical protein [Paenibacillus sp. NPDC055715]